MRGAEAIQNTNSFTIVSCFGIIWLQCIYVYVFIMLNMYADFVWLLVQSKCALLAVTKTWDRNKTCLEQLKFRGDKSSSAEEILSYIPTTRRAPVSCSKNITIYHFKFISGVVDYLNERASRYRDQLKLSWWDQSSNLAKYITADHGKICVHCKASECRNASKEYPWRKWNTANCDRSVGILFISSKHFLFHFTWYYKNTKLKK